MSQKVTPGYCVNVNSYKMCNLSSFKPIYVTTVYLCSGCDALTNIVCDTSKRVFSTEIVMVNTTYSTVDCDRRGRETPQPISHQLRQIN